MLVLVWTDVEKLVHVNILYLEFHFSGFIYDDVLFKQVL